MKAIREKIITAALVAALFLAWKEHMGHDAALAQTRKPIHMTRIYAGPDGQSHAEEIEMKLSDRGLADFKATGAQFSSRLASPGGSDWHTGPRRQLVITLSGRAEIEVSDGKKIAVGPGQIDLIEDTTGKGHITRNLEDRIVVTIPLVD